MRLYHYFFCFLLLYTYSMNAVEYIYPVAFCNEDNTIFYIHQTSPTHITLYWWNLSTNIHEPLLWSLFNPAGVQLLPNNKGFSFIDNGRLRIKMFEKRSPKTIDCDEPLFNINGMHWLDEHTCYCSARRNNYFSLFQLYDDGRVHRLICDSAIDCMYPQKINDQLFYIERYRNDGNHDFNYAIKQTVYDKNSSSHIILNFYDKPVIFLHMLSEEEGFVIEHEKNIDSESTQAYFQYHHIIKESDTWQQKLLFSFTVPTNLFLYDNEQRLFESILPLLPRIIDNKIYFVDCSDGNNNLELYFYDVLGMQRNKFPISKQKGHLFVPIQYGTQLCCGGTLNEDNPFLLVF